MKYFGIGLMLALVPLFVKSPYYIHLLITVGMNAILAMTFILMLRAGLISLAIAAFWGIGGYASALLSLKLNLPFWLALPSSVFITGLVALVVGSLLVRNTGFGFLILTVVFGEIAILVFAHFRFFGGYDGIVAIPPVSAITIPFLPAIEFTSKVPCYYLMLILFFIVAISFSAFYASWLGRAWRSIGLNPHLAQSLGVNLFRYRLVSFVMASAAAGLAGSFYAHYYGSVAPTTFNVFKSIYIQMFAILGGLSFPILGPAVGAFIMTVVPELLRVAKEIEPIFTGLILILLVLFLPDGLLSVFMRGHSTARPGANMNRVWNWLKGRNVSTDRERAN